ncbi:MULTISPECIES: hypothetical protein [Tenebrionibacter/Tenebrionicola group]|jgi:type 1 fimbria pilin|uniref:Type 1 fimbrial protein n=2 Tax=Tenebrionibacter/Tenebrionicola group TaxID=2969848 RepID=A0A8K0XXX5_9ENTR|nr:MULTISPECIES: hypothetical protein [Tenebrionibacter/Tenebrionicola group]MBK4715817.1 hypothetical protein [Tenebrionibacter intestinalis]MBV4411457.1 hypothetical protein [Tenebrionicola larvae]MBV5096627.1 hypothetical protein [Tenebrionicola larvae]
MNALNRLTLAAAGVIVSGMMNSTTAFADTDGVIQFSGEIIEDPCTVVQKQNTIHSTCRDSDGTLLTTQLLPRDGTLNPLPADKGKTWMRWMNDSHTTGVLTVEYN